MRAVRMFAALCFLSVTALAEPFTFTHLAGTPGGAGSSDGIGASARFDTPRGVALVGGTLYVTDSANATIRTVSIASRNVSTLAGLAGTRGVLDGGRAAARLAGPMGIASDVDGNLYFAEPSAQVIRKVTPSGAVTTYAGVANSAGSSDGTLVYARFNQPYDVAVDEDGNVFVADYGNHTIRKITPAGMVSTVAGFAGSPGSANGSGDTARFNGPAGVAVDADGYLYVADSMNHTIRKITPTGVVSTLAGRAGTSGTFDGDGSAARFNTPHDVAVAADGTLWVADKFNHTIRRITAPDHVFTFAGAPGALGAVDDVWILARFAQPLSVAVDDADGSVYVADSLNCVIRRIATDSSVSTLAGTAAATGTENGNGTAARFHLPSDVVFDSHSWIFVADSGNHTIRKISGPLATVSTFAGRAGTQGTADGRGSAARFREPTGLAIDGSDNLYVVDRSNHTIRKIEPDGDVTTLAGLAGVSGSANGTGDDARFNYPLGAAWYGSFVYVTDSHNHTIRKVSTTGVVTTFAGMAGTSGSADGGAAARFNAPRGIVADDDGNLYVADTVNHTIRKITSTGMVSTIAGTAGMHGDDDGIGAAARFYYPYNITLEHREDGVYLFVTDHNHLVRMIAPGNVVTTLAGNPGNRGASDGTGSIAQFHRPKGLAVLNGALFVADEFNNCIRRGEAALETVATIDEDSGPMSVVRHLGASPAATTYLWSLVRRPAGSSAALSATAVRTPTFTPDRPDVYRFRLVAGSAAGQSITEVAFSADCPDISITPSSLATAHVDDAWTVTFAGSGGQWPYVFDRASGVFPTGMTLSPEGTLSGTPGNVGSFDFRLRVTDGYACRVTRDYTLNVVSIDAPTALVATANGSASVGLTWSGSAGAAGYKVFRGTTLTASALIATVTEVTYTDSTVAANTSYIYTVRAYDAVARDSADSNADFATTVAWTDPSLVIGTTVKAAHVTQLRTAANALRGLAGLAPYGFGVAPVEGDEIRALQVQQLRSALTPARTALGRTTTYTDDPLGTSDTIKAIHVNELRNGVK